MVSTWYLKSMSSSPDPKFQEHGLPQQEVREELKKICRSTIFANSERISRFLQFTVEQALVGKADTLKEYVIGVEVYDRKPPYHPGQDSIVRTEARRLRKKLKEYYEHEGKDDPVLIYFRLGSYAPVFRAAGKSVESRPEASKSQSNSPASSGLAIAVLPFTALTEDPLCTTCATGLTHEVIDAFNKTDGFRVVAERSSFQIASQPLAVPQIATDLGVQFLIDGTVAREGDCFRVTAQLVHEDGFQLWSERFETQLERQDVFYVLERIASALVSRVRPSCGNFDNSPDHASSPKVALYRQLLTAEALLYEEQSGGLEEVLRRFQTVIKIDPDYARAHAGVAGCYCSFALSGASGSATAVARGKEAALQAIRMQPDMVAGHSWLGCLSALEWKWKEAELSFKKALSLGGSTTARWQFAQFLCALERFDEAWRLLQESEKEDLFSQGQKVAHCRCIYLSREFGEVEKYLAEAIVCGPQPVESRVYLALSEIRLGHLDRASKMGHALRREVGLQPALMGRIAEILALCGEKDQATNLVNDWGLLAQKSPISSFRQALLSLVFGNNDGALSMLAKALNERDAELIWLAAEPALDPIRSHPEFIQILEQVRPHQRHSLLNSKLADLTDAAAGGRLEDLQ